MKRSTLLAGLLLTCLSPATLVAQQIHIGVIAGANISDLRVTDEFDQELGSDGHRELAIGAIAEIPINQYLALRLTPMWSRSGALMLPNDPTSVDIDAAFDIVQLPVLFSVRLPRRIQPFVAAGPSVGYVINSEMAASISGVEFTGDAAEITRRWSLGLVAAAGASVAVGPVTVFWEGRYEFGLTDLHRPGSVTFTAGSVAQAADFPDPAQLSTRDVRLLLGAMIEL